MVLWISLPHQWQLQDVQAGLNIVIAVLSAIATYRFVRFCWQTETHRIRNEGQAPLSTLLTTNTLGEVYDAVLLLLLLKFRILNRQHSLPLFPVLHSLRLLSVSIMFRTNRSLVHTHGQQDNHY